MDLIRDLQFGRAENIPFRNGDPVLGAHVRVIRTFTFAGESDNRRRPASDDFVLKRPVVEMLERLNRIGTGTITRLDVKAGLPCLMAVEESLSPAGPQGSVPTPGIQS